MGVPAIARVALFSIVLGPAAAEAQVPDVISERPPGEGPTRIEVGFYVIDLMKVNDRDETFEADVFILASWKDPRWTGERVRVVSTEDVWMPDVVVFNERDLSSKLPEEVVIRPDGTVEYRQRLIGTFASSLDLRQFPLDSQTLEIRLVVYGASTDEVVLVDSPDFGVARSANFAIADWEVGEFTVETSSFDPVPGLRLSSLAVRVEVRRLIGYYIVQLLVPLVLVIGLSWIAFWIDPSVVNVRASVCVTGVLTLIAYRFMFRDLVPKLPYLTRIDYLLLGSTLLVAASLATVVFGAYLERQERHDTVSRVDRVARIVFPIGFLVLLVAVRLAG